MDDQTPGNADRWQRGAATMDELLGTERATAIRDDYYARVFPDYGRFVVESGFGDVYSRPGLGLRDRQLVTIAALITLGGTERELVAHVNGALNVGVTADELFELVLQTALYAGIPRAGSGLDVVRKVCDERGVIPARTHPDPDPDV